jgi:hypothetical protein
LRAKLVLLCRWYFYDYLEFQMLKRNQIYTAMLAVTVATVSVTASAQETESGTAGVTVSNAFTLDATTDLDLGTFLVSYILADASEAFVTAASIELKGDGSYGTPVVGVVSAGSPGANDAASFTQIAAGTPGVFTISGAAPNVSMTITMPTDVDIPKLGDPSTFFTLVTIDDAGDDDIVVLDGPAAGQEYSTANLITDATGTVSFAYGGTLSLPTALAAVSANPFTDGTYTATFDVTVEY